MICHPARFAKALVPEPGSHYPRRVLNLCLHRLRCAQRAMKRYILACSRIKGAVSTALKRTPFCAAPLLACIVLMLATAAQAQPAQGTGPYADEDRDWGIAPTNRLRQQPYHAPTPLTIPGAKVVQTRELRAMLAGARPPLLIDVLGEEGHLTLAGAVWLSGAGRGTNFVDPVQAVLTPLLEKLTINDKTRALVFFCANSQCWLSYNAALRAVAAGYRAVYWYRGGVEAWAAAGLPTAKTSTRSAAP
jgi:PQQ-dependent catabolism-associated CXXCW motif protein